MHGRARPERVTALGSTGIASSRLGVLTEDTITLAVQWRNRAAHGDGDGDATFAGGSLGHATYTSSWAAPKSDVHSQQRWFYLGQKGELNVDQAHRGYTVATDGGGFASVRPPRGPNPLPAEPCPTRRVSLSGQPAVLEADARRGLGRFHRAAHVWVHRESRVALSPHEFTYSPILRVLLHM